MDEDASSSLSSVREDVTENIQFMKLLHELKAKFPTVPDAIVRHCVLKVRKNQIIESGNSH